MVDIAAPTILILIGLSISLAEFVSNSPLRELSIAHFPDAQWILFNNNKYGAGPVTPQNLIDLLDNQGRYDPDDVTISATG